MKTELVTNIQPSPRMQAELMKRQLISCLEFFNKHGMQFDIPLKLKDSGAAELIIEARIYVADSKLDIMEDLDLYPSAFEKVREVLEDDEFSANLTMNEFFDLEIRDD